MSKPTTRYVVTEQWMKWAFNHGAEYAMTADCPPNFPQELQADARIMTQARWQSFLERVLHGDEEHRQWLRAEFVKEWENE